LAELVLGVAGEEPPAAAAVAFVGIVVGIVVGFGGIEAGFDALAVGGEGVVEEVWGWECELFVDPG
jgi:hypothetical protein